MSKARDAADVQDGVCTAEGGGGGSCQVIKKHNADYRACGRGLRRSLRLCCDRMEAAKSQPGVCLDFISHTGNEADCMWTGSRISTCINPTFPPLLRHVVHSWVRLPSANPKHRSNGNNCYKDNKPNTIFMFHTYNQIYSIYKDTFSIAKAQSL